MISGGAIISTILVQQGVKFIFTLCGGHISPILTEADKAGIRVIDTRHEATAVFAADCVGRLTGVPGIAVVTAGPGLTNTVTAIKNAQMAQSPVILFGGAAATLLKGRGSLQDIDQMEVIKPHVKWTASIDKVSQIIPILEKAFSIANSGTPGPVFIECPVDILYPSDIVREWYLKNSSSKPNSFVENIKQWYIKRHLKKLFSPNPGLDFQSAKPVKHFPLHNRNQLLRASKMIAQSSKPLMILGSGSMLNPLAVHHLSQAITQLGIPVYLSGMGRGLLGNNHPLHIRHKRKLAIKEADLVILAGVPNDFRLDYGNHIGSRTFISINRNRKDLYLNKKPSLAIEADPGKFIIELANHHKGQYHEWTHHLQTKDREREEEIDAQASGETELINPLALFRSFDQLKGNNSIIIADGGDFVATASYMLSLNDPLSWLDPGAFGTLGVGAGFALGAKLVYPEKDVWIVYGDGSAGYSLMEYDTFTRHGIPVISIIGNDACWSQIARDQIEILESDCAVMLNFSEYEKIAHAFGAKGTMVNTLEEFKKSVTEALKLSRSGTPFIINAKIGKSDFRKGSLSM